MYNSLFSFVFKTIAGAFLSCKRPRFYETSDSSSENDSEEEEPKQEVITKHPRRKVDIRNISKESSFSDIWSYVDNGEKDVNILDKRPFKLEKSYKQKKKTEKFNMRETTTDTPQKFRDLNLSNLNKCISLKILREEEDIHVINEFIINVKHLKKNFRSIRKIIPRYADEYIEVPYSAKACIILFRFLFDDTYYINSLDAAYETLELAQDTQMEQLIHECSAIIDNAYFTKNLVVSKCFIGFSILSIPDIYFPLYPIQLTLNEAFEKDIINTATIESENGGYLIVGVELCFNTETENRNLPLTIIYKVSSDNFYFENEIEVSLNPFIRIVFNEDLSKLKFVSPKLKVIGQKIEISIIVQDIKPSLCFSSLDTQYMQKTIDGEYYVSLSSSRKTDSNDSLFYLKKIYIYNMMSELT